MFVLRTFFLVCLLQETEFTHQFWNISFADFTLTALIIINPVWRLRAAGRATLSLGEVYASKTKWWLYMVHLSNTGSRISTCPCY